VWVVPAGGTYPPTQPWASSVNPRTDASASSPLDVIVFGREVSSVTVSTSEVDTAFAAAEFGDKITLTGGIYNSATLFLNDKYVSITCSSTGLPKCVWDGQNSRGIANVMNNLGETTLERIVLRNGVRSNGGALIVLNADLRLVTVSLMNNAATHGGAIYVEESHVNLIGVFFTGNTSPSDWNDIYKCSADSTVLVSGCDDSFLDDGFFAMQGATLVNNNLITETHHSHICQQTMQMTEVGIDGAFAAADNGEEIVLETGDLTCEKSASNGCFSFVHKYVSMRCKAKGVETCVFRGRSLTGTPSSDNYEVRAVWVKNNGGTTSFTSLTFRDWDIRSYGGSAIFVWWAICELTMCQFINNQAGAGAVMLSMLSSSPIWYIVSFNTNNRFIHCFISFLNSI